MAERPWVTPDELKDYTSHKEVTERDEKKLSFDISRAELKVISITNNRFESGEDYPKIPEPVKMAVILIAEAYAKNAIESAKKQLRSETFDEYSYTVEAGTINIEDLDIEGLLDGYVIAAGRGRTTMKMRVL